MPDLTSRGAAPLWPAGKHIHQPECKQATFDQSQMLKKTTKTPQKYFTLATSAVVLMHHNCACQLGAVYIRQGSVGIQAVE